MTDETGSPDGDDLAAEAAAASSVGGPAGDVARDHASETADWVDCGWQAVMPTMVEHVVAEQLWASDPEGTRWRGGNNPGYDVIGSGERVDAKTAWYGTGVLAGRLCFAAPEQFDADRVQAVAPVVLVNARLAWAAQPGGGGRIVGAYDDAEMWKIPVTLVNRLMQRHSKAKSSILLKDIAQYKVNRHRGHVPPPE